MAERALWRQVFDAVDRRVAGPVEAGTRSDAFTDALAVTWRLQRRLRRGAERQSARALHLLNLPAARDVQRLSTQVAELRREVRELSRDRER